MARCKKSRIWGCDYQPILYTEWLSNGMNFVCTRCGNKSKDGKS